MACPRCQGALERHALAADLMPTGKRDDMRALGYVGAAPIYHHDLRLSGDVIGRQLSTPSIVEDPGPGNQ